MERLNALSENVCTLCEEELTSLRSLRHHVHTEHGYTFGGRRIRELPAVKRPRLATTEPTTSAAPSVADPADVPADLVISSSNSSLATNIGPEKGMTSAAVSADKSDLEEGEVRDKVQTVEQRRPEVELSEQVEHPEPATEAGLTDDLIDAIISSVTRGETETTRHEESESLTVVASSIQPWAEFLHVRKRRMPGLGCRLWQRLFVR